MVGAKLGVSDYLSLVCQEIRRLDPDQIERVSELVEAAYDGGHFVFICGNGGSGANASHLCEDLAKCTLRDFENQKRLKVLSLTDNTAGIMAWANDEGYDRIFVEQLKNLASPGDLLLAISGSGNSPNILKAVAWANEQGLTTVGFTGFSGGKLKTLAHYNLHAAIDDMGVTESLHQVVFHWIIDDLYRRFSAKAAVSIGAREPADRMVDSWVLGIEIGGTKLQLGIGHGQGSLAALARFHVDPSRGATGILEQIQAAVPTLLAKAGLAIKQVEAIGIGFGGPVDPVLGRTRKSYQVPGWDDFPLTSWISSQFRVPLVVLENDADSAGLAESRFGAGVGFSPLLYITVGSGIGGTLIVSDRIYRGFGHGAAELGHLRVPDFTSSRVAWLELEQVASGWGIATAAQNLARRMLREGQNDWVVLKKAQGRPSEITAAMVAEAVTLGDPESSSVLDGARTSIAFGLTQAIALLAPRRIVIGGGVSLIGEKDWFDPIRLMTARDVFQPFRNGYDIVPAMLGEEVVVHGALALARDAADKAGQKA